MILRMFAVLTVVLGMIGCSATSGRRRCEEKVEHYGMVIGVRPEKIDYYKQLHAKPWPGVLRKISECNIRNYSIYLKQVDDQHWYLFSYFEYTGQDFDADMKKMSADPETQRWWEETAPCQTPIPLHEGEGWAPMEQVFYHP